MPRFLSVLVLAALLGSYETSASATTPAEAAGVPIAQSSPDQQAVMPGISMPAMQAPDDDAPMQMQMTAMFGSYPMSREASGTSWQPDATPEQGVDTMVDGWSVMAHGYIDAVADHQGGPRGNNMLFSPSMLMLMAECRLGPGTLALHGMFSLDPLMGPAGYPLLFASGETANGQSELVDRQHPHDLFMELAGSYSMSLTSDLSGFVYLGLPGEPALGPPAFMHRFSGEEIPEAPISHHWLDATHITEGVATLGLVLGPVKFEASSFNGREPDQFRYNIETRSFDSKAARISWNPSAEWSLQISQGFLKSPEQLEPDVSVERRTASAIYQTSIAGMAWGTTLAWGENRRSSGTDTAALLLESTLRLNAYTLFARAEHLGNDELFAAPSTQAGDVFKVGESTVGAIDDFYRAHHLAVGVGALVSRYSHAAALDSAYGHATSEMIFLRAKLSP